MDGTYRGKVTRTDAQGVYVEVPKLGIGVEFGPLQVLMTPFIDDMQTDAAGQHTHSVSVSVSDTYTGGGSGSGTAATAGDHRHHLTSGRIALRRGHDVLVSTVAGVKEDLVILGRIA